MLHFCVFAACHPRRSPGRDFGAHVSPRPLRPDLHEINAQFASRMGLRDLSSLECAVTEKHRVLPVFNRNRPHLSPLECAVLRIPVTVDSKWFTEKANSFRMRTYEKTGGCLLQATPPSSRAVFSVLAPSDHALRSVSHLPYTLPSSVSRKSFGCRSYENTGECGGILPILELTTRHCHFLRAITHTRWRRPFRRKLNHAVS